MTLRVVWLSEAKAEFDEAKNLYKGVRAELGKRFGLAVKAAVTAMQSKSEGYQRIHNEIRRATLRGFPHGLLYRIEAKQILVIACFHPKRSPEHWQTR